MHKFLRVEPILANPYFLLKTLTFRALLGYFISISNVFTHFLAKSMVIILLN